MAITSKLRLLLFTTLSLFLLSTLLHTLHRSLPITSPSISNPTTHSTFTTPNTTITSSFTSRLSRSPKNAYIFYATSNTYACSALVNIHRLSRFHHHNSTVPGLIALITPAVSPSLVKRLRATGAVVMVLQPPRVNSVLGGGDYYRESLLKLRALGVREMGREWSGKRGRRKRSVFGTRAGERAHDGEGLSNEDAEWMMHLERVVVLDSDQLVMQRVNELFEMDVGEDGLAAPEAWWLSPVSPTSSSSSSSSSSPTKPFFTSALLAANLTHPTLWPSLTTALSHPHRGEYDMDLLNRLIPHPHILPSSYCILNSIFRRSEPPDSLGEFPRSLEQVWESETKVLHFTDGGKPWEFILPETGEEVAENGGGEKREGGWNSLRRGIGYGSGRRRRRGFVDGSSMLRCDMEIWR
ncbi:hypothetical protein EX30DRAFT_216913 [Ascodesmis nigricans]|uniref:Nucleotide-diphospho-sugar transferase n=1 Tax=Ascodesmis nigricans TaxID=341454 RepID=A0A4S2MZC7_9PEZI|nr:hypothetical protein EX30DRAFT_216913 [Ascodesmis nigricans]